MGAEVKRSVLDNETEFNGQTVIKDSPHYVSYSPMYDINGELVGAFFAGSNVSEATDEFAVVTIVIILCTVVIAVICGIIIKNFAHNKITVPIDQVTALAKEMQVGRLGSSDVNYRFADDEVGDYAKVLKQTKDSLHYVVNDASVILNDISNGIVDKKPEVDYPGDFETIKESIP